VLSSLQAYESNMTGIETTDDNEGEVDLDHQGFGRNDVLESLAHEFFIAALLDSVPFHST